MSPRPSLALHTKIFIGLFVGLVAGILCNVLLPNDEGVKWVVSNIAYPAGQVFLRLIFMVIIPLIFSALALGVADIGDVRKIGRIGLKTLAFTVVITGVSVFIGMGLVNIVQPGTGIPETDRNGLLATLTNNQAVSGIFTAVKESKSFVQTLLDLIPRNPFADMANALDPNYRGGGLLAIMFLALIFGGALSLCAQERVAILTKTLQGLYDVVMKIIDFAMKLAPYGVAGLMFSTASQMGLAIVLPLMQYILVVVGGLAIQQFVTYGLIVKYAAKRKPIEFFKGIREVMLTAFSTSSSNATLPTSLRVTEQNLNVHPDVSKFVLTVGSTANQNGTALYEGVTVLFLAQFYGIELSLVQQLVVVLMSILAGVGTAGVPGGSLPLVVIVLQAVGIPAEGIGIILGVDRILDMCRTVVNVTGDIALATWVDVSERLPTRR
ncbi:MAG TPA: dicarboxylate/amino acid:cation symporter [Bacteroidetes bacterium]|nr:dicarboxylate/amino acid:cation symporter [Bacteroidota bacterium]